ncbi:MAG TPA: hypothetical protein VJP76_09045 [Candidatus Tumulicola sp.]|nr:hypothetical protein [Candidatus Tumulicola sp.]
MRSRTRRIAAWTLAAWCAAAAAAIASVPSTADLDASARAAGNRIDVATHIGERVFAETWPAEVSQISANEVGDHLVVGVRLWGVKFHHAVTREEFVDEVAAIVTDAFDASAAEEVDVWASVPIEVGKDTVVSGDLARPTVRTVFTLTAHRGQSAEAIAALALAKNSPDVFWDETWARDAFRPAESRE